MFKDLYQLSKTGEITQMKNLLEDTLSKQETHEISVSKYPNSCVERNHE